jgi:hypothetical protein
MVTAFLLMLAGRIEFTTVPADRPRGDPPKTYIFHEDLSRPVAVYAGEFVLLGKLDNCGEFLRESKNPKSSPSLPEWRKIAINPPTPPGRKVYEFRSGRLIKGEIKEDGSFVPDVASKVTDFKDYEYSPGGIQIYNLPGRFIEATKANEKR